MMEYDLDELSGIYRDEANDCLCEAWYEDLYAGNPFDWMFLYAAQQPEPLDSFRELVGIIMERDI